MMYRFALVCLCWLFTGPSAGAQTIWLQRDTQAFELQGMADQLMESGTNLDVEAVAGGKAGRWVYAPIEGFVSLDEAKTLWIRLALQRTADAPDVWTLHIPKPYLDQVTLFTPTAEGPWNRQVAGDTLEVSRWTQPGLYPDFTLRPTVDEPLVVYLQIRNFKSISTPIRLASEEQRRSQRDMEFTGIGIALGALLILVGVCALHYLQTRDKADAWYTAYNALMVVVVAAATGLMGRWFWYASPLWGNVSYSVLPIVGMGATLLFVRHVCALHVAFPKLDRFMRSMALLAVPLILCNLVLSRVNVDHMYALYLMLGLVLCLLATGRTWRRGHAVGRWLLLSFLPQGATLLVLAAEMLRLFPVWWQTRYIMILAMGCAVPLMLQAFQIRARERREAEERVNALGTQDALTGLLLRPVFLEQVRAALKRARREREPSAILLIDVVNFPQLRKIYGDAIAEQCLLRAVVKLHRVLRDVDPVGRVDSSRFGLILDGVSTRQAINERMVRLIASGLIPLPGLKPEVTLQFHVACVLLTDVIPDDDQVLAQLSDLLAGISPRTRRPIRFIEPAMTQPAPLYSSDSGFGEATEGPEDRRTSKSPATTRPTLPTGGSDISVPPSTI